MCDAPTAVSISAAPETFDLGETVELTVGVDAPCDPSVEHRVSVSTRPADDVPDCPVTPTPVTTLVVPAGRSATSTVTVRPLSSSEYLAALDGAVYSQLPSTTVTSRYPAPGTPPPRTTTTTGPAVAGQVRDVTVEGATCVVDLFARTARDGTVRIVRTGTPAPGTGTVSFSLRPTDDTVVWAQSRDRRGVRGGRSNDLPLDVVRAVSLSAHRDGPRTVTFIGVTRPAAAGLLVSLYRATSHGPVLTAQARTDGSGRYTVRRIFSGRGRHTFSARTAADALARTGTSPARSIDVR